MFQEFGKKISDISRTFWRKALLLDNNNIKNNINNDNNNNNNNKTTSKQLGCDLIVISLVPNIFYQLF